MFDLFNIINIDVFIDTNSISKGILNDITNHGEFLRPYRDQLVQSSLIYNEGFLFLSTASM